MTETAKGTPAIRTAEVVRYTYLNLDQTISCIKNRHDASGETMLQDGAHTQLSSLWEQGEHNKSKGDFTLEECGM